MGVLHVKEPYKSAIAKKCYYIGPMSSLESLILLWYMGVLSYIGSISLLSFLNVIYIINLQILIWNIVNIDALPFWIPCYFCNHITISGNLGKFQELYFQKSPGLLMCPLQSFKRFCLFEIFIGMNTHATTHEIFNNRWQSIFFTMEFSYFFEIVFFPLLNNDTVSNASDASS